MNNELGIRVHEGGVAFCVWAPFASAVSVMGDFNDWSHDATPLARDESTGNWSVDVASARVGQEYKYVIHNGDQVLFHNDPRALQLSIPDANSVIIDPHFDWQDGDFKLPPPQEQVIYELHVGTFNRPDPATPGTFMSAAEKLDYLKDLGINVIELMPCSSSTTDRWWGYTPDHLYAVDATYGGRHAFMAFVQAAHERGIGVILDVVYNHLSPDAGMDLWQFDGWNENGQGGIYFYNDWRGETPWGNTRLDYGRPEVRQYITDNVRMWMRDCHVDGLRVDSTHNIRAAMGLGENGPDIPDGWKVLQEITAAAREIHPTAILIAEDSTSHEGITKSVDQQGAGFTAQWDTSIPYILREVLDTPADEGRDLSRIIYTLKKGYNSDAFDRVIYSESHDIAAQPHARLAEEIAPGDADGLFARRRSALAAALILTAPGIPMLFQGQESMETGHFNHWQALDWHKVEAFHGIVQLYRDLIALRRDQRSVTRGLQGQSLNILHDNSTSKVLAYHRWDQGGAHDDVVIAINFSNTLQRDYQIKFPRSGSWKVRFNSDWEGYGADFTNIPTPDVAVESDTGAINLAPYAVVILSQD